MTHDEIQGGMGGQFSSDSQLTFIRGNICALFGLRSSETTAQIFKLITLFGIRLIVNSPHGLLLN